MSTTDEEKTAGLMDRMRGGLAKTREQFASGLGNLMLGEKALNETALEELETSLLLADVGIPATTAIIEELTLRASRRELADTKTLYRVLSEVLIQRLAQCGSTFNIEPRQPDALPKIIFFVGVNGVGKTTTIGKLAKRLQDQGLKVMLAAGDTFRAAAVEQLQSWGERNNIPVIAQRQGSDSASVAYDAVASAQAKGMDVLLVDTAGRLQAKVQLMDELSKIRRVIKRLDQDAPHEVILVLDGGVGQNAISQLTAFNEAIPVTGLVITKLDGTAKAGVIFALAATALGGDSKPVPIHFIGVGEAEEDLRVFAPDEFVHALLALDSGT